ncbi:MAG TPA: ABC transporter substrate-binding protein [Dongiaceae bacterium]|jgi:trehalose/maltose transport system substrate-binding protein|nr:ABC transporter substrate-binding protein [Dongiaceae bacterium]
MKLSSAKIFASLGLGLIFATASLSAQAATVSISCGAVGQEADQCKQGVEAWAKKTGNQVKIVSTPTSSTDQLALYQQVLAAKSGDIDVFQIDVVWPGILGTHFVDLGKSFSQEEIERHFPPIIANNTIKGHLIAMPWFTDAGLLYYRKDLLDKYGKKAPTTWQELTDTAKEIQDKERAAGNSKMHGFVFQGKAYEGLTCVGLEWIDSFGGGQIIDGNGKVTVNNPKAAEALTWAASTIGTIAPEGVLNYQEEEARGVFQAGDAVFMRNWPYAWSLANAADSPVKGKIGVTAVPKGSDAGKLTGALGGWELAVSKYSKNQAAAIDLVKYLTSPEEQKRRAIAGSFNPTIMSLYNDKEVTDANPFMAQLYDTFANAVARPSRASGLKYNQLSSDFFNAVQSVLRKQTDASSALKQLAAKLNQLSHNGKW